MVQNNNKNKNLSNLQIWSIWPIRLIKSRSRWVEGIVYLDLLESIHVITLQIEFESSIAVVGHSSDT